MRIDKPLWHDGLILTQQHFQQQDQWTMFAMRQIAGAVLDHPQLIAHFQPALLARFQTLVYRPLDAVALADIVRLKLVKVAERPRRQHEVELVCDDSLIAAMAELCLARESGARNVDAFLNQRILPPVSRELLTRMATGTAPAKIVLSSSTEGDLTIDFVDPNEPVSVTAPGASVA